jgi:hypothetical protein
MEKRYQKYGFASAHGFPNFVKDRCYDGDELRKAGAR